MEQTKNHLSGGLRRQLCLRHGRPGGRRRPAGALLLPTGGRTDARCGPSGADPPEIGYSHSVPHASPLWRLSLHPEEIQLMELQIPRLASAGANGFVIGCLTPEGRLDRRSMERLVNAAGGRGLTLHRAFDVSRTLQKPWLTPLAWESTPSSPAVRPPIAGPGGNVWASSWPPALPWK